MPWKDHLDKMGIAGSFIAGACCLGLHDLRHRFAVRTLIDWYRSGKDSEAQLPVLSTFLGHSCVRDTYWYLSEHPALMKLAVQRLDARWEGAL